MSNPNDHDLPAELDQIGARLRSERREATALELDELRSRVRVRSARAGAGGSQLKNRLVTAILTVALVGGGGGAVLASGSGGGGDGGGPKGKGAANSQYCPPKSPGAGKPKNPPPGNKCGHPNNGHD